MMDAASVKDQDHCKGLFLLNDPTSASTPVSPGRLVGLDSRLAGIAGEAQTLWDPVSVWPTVLQ